MTEQQSIQDEMGQVIANSFFGMEAGYMPTEPHELPTPSSGDLQLAFDVLASPVIRRIQAEALREAADWKRGHNLGNSVWGDYLKRLAEEKYQAGGDDMITIWLDDRADRIENAPDV